MGSPWERPSLDDKRPAAARRYDAWRGGKDNLAPDRASAEAVVKVFPAMPWAVRENRSALLRMVRYLSQEVGIQQFLDLGCGMPSPNFDDDVHVVAQRSNPGSRIVYVDYDSVVAVHARALMSSDPLGAVAVHEGDIRDMDKVLSSAAVRDTLDFGKPVAVLMFAVLHFVTDDALAARAVSTVTDAMVPGSYLAMSHASLDLLPADTRDAMEAFTRPDSGHGPFRPRSYLEIAELLAGVEVLKPGLVPTV